jgi:hypothetical protein
MVSKLIGIVASFMMTASFSFSAVGVNITEEQELKTIVFNNVQVEKPATTTIPSLTPKTFTHGDCSWIPPLALKAGWETKTHAKLINIILRESGCCPNRRGGDKVDKNCNITGVSEWNHRSDTGLLQINGVHWKQDHAQYHGLVCKKLKICSQEPLLEPLNNLLAGKLLFDKVGWSPWGVVTKP